MGAKAVFCSNIRCLATRILVAVLLYVMGCAGGFCASSAPQSPVFSASHIISPIPGTWGNRQPLLVDVPDGWEVYYSITDSDPLLFGFAYDGPSLLEKDGDVHLKVTAMDRTGRRYDFTVDYTVKSYSQLGMHDGWNAAQRKFIVSISMNPIRKYTAGTVLSIPEGFSYAASAASSIDGMKYFKGGLLSLGGESSVVRYVPFVVTDGQEYFRFIVRTVPARESFDDAALLPFSLSDWETILPNDASYVYRLDDGPWQGKLSALYVDRGETHVLFWKKESEADDSKAESLVFYPKPSLGCRLRDDGTCAFFLNLPFPHLEGYRLGRPVSPSFPSLKQLSSPEGLHEKLVMDAFPGEDLSGSFTCGVYLNGLYQGNLCTEYHLDRLPPAAPKIVPADVDFRVLGDGREVRLESEEGARLFYAASGGLPLEDGHPLEAGISLNDGQNLPGGQSSGTLPPDLEFTGLEGNSFILPAQQGHACLYRVYAYAVDSAGNRGEPSELSVVVGGRNIYVDAGLSRNGESGNGSWESPFSSFERAVEAANLNGFSVLHIQGTVPVQSSVVLAKSCSIVGSSGVLSFSADAVFCIDHADVAITDCSLVKDGSGEDGFITVQDGSLSCESCDISASFEKEGCLVRLRTASFSALSSSFSAYSSSYSALIDSCASQVRLSSSTCALSSYTAVAFCMVDSDFSLEKSLASVSCYTGRIAELSGGSFRLVGNFFTGFLRAEGLLGAVQAVRTGGGARQVLFESNRTRGFKE